MKIGILTFHRAINFGAVLQCYALYSILKGMGHEVEVIDYRPESVERYRRHFRLVDFRQAPGVGGKLRYLASALTLARVKPQASRRFDAFLSRNMRFSSVVHRPEDIATDYEAVFFGSDQIWNPVICEGLDRIYYGQFPKGRARFVAYAASVGNLGALEGDTLQRFTACLTAYDRLAVREQNLQTFLRERVGREAHLVCDPSLLLTRADWEALAEKPQEENYVALFILERNPETLRFAQRMASQLGAKVIRLGATENPFRKSECEVRSMLSPGQFLGYLKHARCVVTDSFHATSFSLIMHTDFYTMRRTSNNSRAETILGVAGLGHRLVDATAEFPFAPIPYEGMDERLDAYRQLSLRYIRESLPANE